MPESELLFDSSSSRALTDKTRVYLIEAYSNLAVVYLQTGRFDEAERAVKSAEKVGFKVNPMLKEDIAAKKKAGS